MCGNKKKDVALEVWAYTEEIFDKQFRLSTMGVAVGLGGV